MKQNKKVIQKVWKEEFNKEQLKEEILANYERKKQKTILYQKFAFLTLCIMVLGTSFFVSTLKENANQNTPFSQMESSASEQLNINDYNYNLTSSYGTEEYQVVKISKDTLLSEVPILKNIPFSTSTIEKWYQNKKMIGYHVVYTIEEQIIDLFLSQNQRYRFAQFEIDEDAKDSIILQTPIKIFQSMQNQIVQYFIYFENNNFYYDIKTTNLNDTELIELIQMLLFAK